METPGPRGFGVGDREGELNPHRFMQKMGQPAQPRVICAVRMGYPPNSKCIDPSLRVTRVASDSRPQDDIGGRVEDDMETPGLVDLGLVPGR